MMRRNEGGMATLEVVLALPVLIMLALFVVGLGRMAEARSTVDAAAFDAARAASLERNPSMARAVGENAAHASIGATGIACNGLDIQVDVSNYISGGHVAATVSCTANLADVQLAGFSGSKRFTSTATVPIETWRSQ